MLRREVIFRNQNLVGIAILFMSLKVHIFGNFALLLIRFLGSPANISKSDTNDYAHNDSSSPGDRPATVKSETPEADESKDYIYKN